MLRYLVQRLLVMIPTLLVISFLVFAIIQAPPGDYLESMVAEMQITRREREPGEAGLPAQDLWS